MHIHIGGSLIVGRCPKCQGLQRKRAWELIETFYRRPTGSAGEESYRTISQWKGTTDYWLDEIWRWCMSNADRCHGVGMGGIKAAKLETWCDYDVEWLYICTLIIISLTTRRRGTTMIRKARTVEKVYGFTGVATEFGKGGKRAFSFWWRTCGQSIISIWTWVNTWWFPRIAVLAKKISTSERRKEVSKQQFLCRCRQSCLDFMFRKV